MPQNERMRVWKGELKKTSGGLTKNMLMKNKRGKVVSRSKSEAAKKNKDNNLGAWLRAKGEQFLSKGLKAENIVRKNKAGRKAFKKEKEEEVPEEKQSEVKPTKKPQLAPKKPVPKKVVAPPKKKKKVVVVPPKKKKVVVVAPPKITKVAPMEAGEEKEPTKISVGNIVVTGGRKALKNYTTKATSLVKQFKLTKKEVLEALGEPPAGFEWSSLGV